MGTDYRWLYLSRSALLISRGFHSNKVNKQLNFVLNALKFHEFSIWIVFLLFVSAQKKNYCCPVK